MSKSTLFGLFMLMVGCSGGGDQTSQVTDPPVTSGYTYQIPDQIDDGIEVGDIHDAGIDLDKIASLINNRSEYLHGILIFRYDKLVLGEYFAGDQMKMTSPITWETQRIQFTRSTPHYLASVTKSFMSALIGICIDRGMIADTNVKISHFYPEYSQLFDLDERKKNITLENVLSMKAGFASNGATTTTAMIAGNKPWAEYVLSQPLEHDPGTFYNYNDGLSVLLGDIVTRASGQCSDLFAQEQLLNKIDIQQPFWDISQWGEVGGGWGLWMIPRNLVKFGNLYLNEGWYDGDYVISPEWVASSWTRTSEVSGNFLLSPLVEQRLHKGNEDAPGTYCGRCGWAVRFCLADAGSRCCIYWRGL
ncbi:MAG: hypothetical protein CO090_04140 [Acidobacteria bacterium CG_4_9_14_3_um_filter_49_7]|nr:MAG: hypothetical protein CO090_04140 [Acidobacteria bacterium CG_4_9_14_3_um_filter_49_7]